MGGRRYYQFGVFDVVVTFYESWRRLLTYIATCDSGKQTSVQSSPKRNKPSHTQSRSLTTDGPGVYYCASGCDFIFFSAYFKRLFF